jgi:hypothetical protein
MNQQRIPVAGPWVTEREVRYVAEAAANDWYGRAGESLKRFERAFADSVGVKYALGVPHCTAALHLAMMALGIGPGDEVIVPESTWVATATPIFYCGATPVFADIDPVNWCVTAESIERCLSPRTKLIITVDLYGGIPDMPAIEALARRKGIPILEDAAQSIGADLNGRKAGALRGPGDLQLPRHQDGDHRRGRDAGDRLQAALRSLRLPARPLPHPGELPPLRHPGDWPQVQDERAPGGLRAGPARAPRTSSSPASGPSSAGTRSVWTGSRG